MNRGHRSTYRRGWREEKKCKNTYILIICNNKHIFYTYLYNDMHIYIFIYTIRTGNNMQPLTGMLRLLSFHKIYMFFVMPRDTQSNCTYYWKNERRYKLNVGTYYKKLLTNYKKETTRNKICPIDKADTLFGSHAFTGSVINGQFAFYTREQFYSSCAFWWQDTTSPCKPLHIYVRNPAYIAERTDTIPLTVVFGYNSWIISVISICT